ncbi:MAG TPA: hypothetical protein VG271_07565 [Beijerinckiaceae bacterium]|nr:hypothetical protein [Beijerinckiaceae bacterium]
MQRSAINAFGSDDRLPETTPPCRMQARQQYAIVVLEAVIVPSRPALAKADGND